MTSDRTEAVAAFDLHSCTAHSALSTEESPCQGRRWAGPRSALPWLCPNTDEPDPARRSPGGSRASVRCRPGLFAFLLRFAPPATTDTGSVLPYRSRASHPSRNCRRVPRRYSRRVGSAQVRSGRSGCRALDRTRGPVRAPARGTHAPRVPDRAAAIAAARAARLARGRRGRSGDRRRAAPRPRTAADSRRAGGRLGAGPERDRPPAREPVAAARTGSRRLGNLNLPLRRGPGRRSPTRTCSRSCNWPSSRRERRGRDARPHRRTPTARELLAALELDDATVDELWSALPAGLRPATGAGARPEPARGSARREPAEDGRREPPAQRRGARCAARRPRWTTSTGGRDASGPTPTTACRDAKLAALAELAAGAGHEINNPLAVISGQRPAPVPHRTGPGPRRVAPDDHPAVAAHRRDRPRPDAVRSPAAAEAAPRRRGRAADRGARRPRRVRRRRRACGSNSARCAGGVRALRPRADQARARRRSSATGSRPRGRRAGCGSRVPTRDDELVDVRGRGQRAGA